MAATALVLRAAVPVPATETGMPAIFGPDEMRALAYKTLVRGCSDTPPPDVEWVTAEESVLAPH